MLLLMMSEELSHPLKEGVANAFKGQTICCANKATS
jgi:hypothetical protein